jgi:Family of unknown function (DUF5946)
MSPFVCPGCGLVAAPGGIPLDRPLNASPGCWDSHAELGGFELTHPALIASCHQLTVDAYGAQHAGPPTGAIRVAYSLVGLLLALDRGWSGTEVREFHQRMGRPDPSWPPFPRPASTGSLTVADVVAAGARADSREGHVELVERWARSVWDAWATEHVAVAQLTDRIGRDLTRTVDRGAGRAVAWGRGPRTSRPSRTRSGSGAAQPPGARCRSGPATPSWHAPGRGRM